MQEFSRDFKGVWIPRVVWFDTRLNALDKIILAEIDSLDQGERGCYASNQYLADFAQCSERKVSAAVSKLIEYGYIYAQKFDGRQRELRSRLENYAVETSKKCETETQILRESNTKRNIETNTERKKESKKAGGSYDEILAAYTVNEDLKQALLEFIKMRKLIKKPLTDRALRLILSKLDTLATTDGAKIDILNQSIVNNWQGVFPLKNYSNGRQQQTTPQQQPTESGLSDHEILLAAIEREEKQHGCAGGI